MLDSEDLHGRVGQFEQAISAFHSKQKVLLERLQDGLALARERLVERKHEVERLKRENLELQQIIDRLLESIEGRSKDAMGDQLGALDRELDSLIALADEETPSAAVAAVPSAPASPVERAPASPDSAPAFAKASSDDDELASAFSDIERRIQELARHFPTGASAEEAEDTAPPDAPEVPPSAPVASAPVDTVEPEAAVAPSTLSADPPKPETAAAPAPAPADSLEPEAPVAPPPAAEPEAAAAPPPEPETAAAPPPAPKAKPVRTAASPEYCSSPRPQSRPQPAKAYAKTRGPLDAEVGYALSVLRQMRRSDKLFSIDDVRELINGKFGLDLTAHQDSQIRACLSRRDGVYPNPKNDSFWRFGDAA